MLTALPEQCCKSAHPAAENTLAEIWNAEDKTHALTAVKAFTSCSARSSPRPLRSLDELLAVYDYPAATQDHWRAVNAPHLVALVRGGSMFVNGKLVEREEDQQAVTPTVETAA